MLVSPLSALKSISGAYPSLLLPLSVCGGVTYASWKWNAYGDGGHFCFSHPLVLHPSLTNAAETWYYYSHPFSVFLQSRVFISLKFVWPGRDFFLFWVSQNIYQYYNFIGVSDKKFKRRAWGRVCKLFEWPCLVETRSTVLSYQQKDVSPRPFFKNLFCFRVIHPACSSPTTKNWYIFSPCFTWDSYCQFQSSLCWFLENALKALCRWVLRN